LFPQPSYCRDIYRIDSRDNLYWYNSAALKAVPSKKYFQQSSSPQTLSPITPKSPQTLSPYIPKSPRTLSPSIPKSPLTLSPPSPSFPHPLTPPKSPVSPPKSPLSPPKSPISPFASPNPMTLWSIDFGDFKCSRILKKSVRPKAFSITHAETGARSTFIHTKKSVPAGYAGEVNTPFDKTCDQRYNWILDSNNEKWSLIQSNDPQRILVEFRKTNIDNEFLIVFLEKPPYGWSPRIADRLSKYLSAKSERMNGSNDRRSSDSSNGSATNSLKSPSLNGSFMSDNDIDDEKHWQEFVLASTVAIQDEVNPKKR
ncbi:7431_t:CDS:1, partial [Dentiscutata heterogama]